MTTEVKIINANIAVDDRGELLHCNEFDMTSIKRFYHIVNYNNPFVRAWHGHKIENKYLLVSKGSALVATVKVDNWNKPSKDLKINKFILSDKHPKLLFIPGGFVHGFKTLLSDTRIIIFSTATLEESQQDDYRFDVNYWNPWKIIER